MKVRAYVHLGLVGCERKESIEIDDEELDGMNEEGRERYIDETVREWVYGQIEWGWDEG